MEKIDWNFCQNNSDLILSDGIMKLINCNSCMPNSIENDNSGNYLISYNNIPNYIGEAKNLKTRIRQQYRSSTSTFYKNYLKNLPLGHSAIDINDYKVQYIETSIGRKEIEDFGIVNLTTELNKFQINKRVKCELKTHDHDIWYNIQKHKEEILSFGEDKIQTTVYTFWSKITVRPISGIYLIENDKKIIYIGESSNLLERYKTHSSQTYFSALRRHIGTSILNFTLKEKNGRKRYFNPNEDFEITKFINQTKVIFLPVSFGRYELEEYLIKKYKPLLNRKGNSIKTQE